MRSARAAPRCQWAPLPPKASAPIGSRMSSASLSGAPPARAVMPSDVAVRALRNNRTGSGAPPMRGTAAARSGIVAIGRDDQQDEDGGQDRRGVIGGKTHSTDGRGLRHDVAGGGAERLDEHESGPEQHDLADSG